MTRGDVQESGGEAQLLYIKSTPSGEAVSGNRRDSETEKPTLPVGEPRPLPIALRLGNVWPWHALKRIQTAYIRSDKRLRSDLEWKDEALAGIIISLKQSFVNLTEIWSA